jgi:hypothetical protein
MSPPRSRGSLSDRRSRSRGRSSTRRLQQRGHAAAPAGRLAAPSSWRAHARWRTNLNRRHTVMAASAAAAVLWLLCGGHAAAAACSSSATGLQRIGIRRLFRGGGQAAVSPAASTPGGCASTPGGNGRLNPASTRFARGRAGPHGSCACLPADRCPPFGFDFLL